VKPTYTEVLLPLSIRKKQTNLEEERPLNETGQPVSKRKNKLRRRMSINPDWANLVSLALDVILEKLIEPIDRIWFASVCKNWYSIANLNHQYNHQFRGNILPMLMIPTENSFEKRSLYSVLANRVYPFELTMLYNQRCCGSSHGWLATIDEEDVITWVNPFKNVAPISLPCKNII
jgi:hypothetical protein